MSQLSYQPLSVTVVLKRTRMRYATVERGAPGDATLVSDKDLACGADATMFNDTTLAAIKRFADTANREAGPISEALPRHSNKGD